MLRNFLIVVAIVVVVGVGGALATSETSALTADEIQTQIQGLLAKIAELTKQLNILRGQSSPPATTPSQPVAQHRICSILYRNLSQGSSGDDVTGLQEFLRSEGYLSANATGYFGPLTADAVARWQTSEGVSSVGSIGPLSRERIKMWCGGEMGALKASPTSGAVPLTINFWYVIGGNSSDGYSIDFGDGTTGALQIGCGTPPNSMIGACPRALVTNHTYTTNGTYIATLTYANDICGGNPMCMAPVEMKVVGKATISVGTSSTVDPSSDPRCKAWYDGCNNCSRETPNGPAMCTLRACIWQAPAYCTAYFDSSSNKPPVISGFSGPTTLSVNQSGTWTVNASDPENGQLSYSVTWGDEHMTPAPMASYAAREAFVQTTTFTHAYSAVGTYNITIVVRDSSGQEAKTSMTVRVGPGPVACTMEAMQCPDGSWVGRTGPACQFICPGSNGTLSGRMTIGPICPVETYPPNPNCRPSAETYAAHVATIYKNDGGTLVTALTPDANGTFSATLAAGNYLLRIQGAYSCSASSSNQYTCSGIGSGSGDLLPIRISANSTSSFSVDIDTGIR